MDERILTIPQVASYLQLSKSKVYSMVSRGEIPHVKFGKSVRVRETGLKEWMDRQAANPAFAQ